MNEFGLNFGDRVRVSSHNVARCTRLSLARVCYPKELTVEGPRVPSRSEATGKQVYNSPPGASLAGQTRSDRAHHGGGVPACQRL